MRGSKGHLVYSVWAGKNMDDMDKYKGMDHAQAYFIRFIQLKIFSNVSRPFAQDSHFTIIYILNMCCDLAGSVGSR